MTLGGRAAFTVIISVLHLSVERREGEEKLESKFADINLTHDVSGTWLKYLECLMLVT